MGHIAGPRVPLLIVDRDSELLRVLAEHAERLGYRPSRASTPADAMPLVRSGAFHAALVDLGLDDQPALDLLRLLKDRSPETETVVTSTSSALGSAAQFDDLTAFAFVQKPFDLESLFGLLDRALERRRMNLDNTRLVWELQTVNEIAEGISRSLELEDVLTGALQQLVRALDASGGSIRLRDDATGCFDVRAFVGPAFMQRLWRAHPSVPRPSDQVIATRAAVVVEDFAELVPGVPPDQLPMRSAISLPILAGAELAGTLSLCSPRPYRFEMPDQRLLGVIAGQIGVAVQNARLHDVVRRGKRDWEQTFDAISDAIAVFDSRGELLRWNAALAAHLGRDIRDLAGTPCRDVGLCGGGCPDCAVGQVLRGRASTAEVTRPDGRIFSVTTFPISEGPSDAAVVQVGKDVTEEIRSARRLRQMSEVLSQTNHRLRATLDRLHSTQAQLLQAEKLSAIGQLVAGVAHELNNPLTSVIGYAQLLEEEMLDSGRTGDRPTSELAADLRRIAEESERAARIVRNLLAFARRQTAARNPQDLAELFGRVLALRSYEMRLNGVEVHTELAEGLPPVVADASQIQQALLNLILNAEQAMRGRTTRRLTVGARFDEEAAAVELWITDSGHGIEPGNLSRVFDPFFTTRDVGEGTGLGLSICYGIVRDHGGQIAVESKVQVGSTFSLLFPARVDEDSAPRVLVAHVEQGERDFLVSALSAWGYTVVGTDDTAQALAHYTQGGVHAAFVDRAVLAADLAGWRAARLHHTMPLVLVGIANDEGEADRFGREEASAVLTPPFQLRALRAVIRAVSKEYV